MMTSNNQLRIVIVGTGNVATQLSNWILKHTDMKLAGVYGRDKDELNLLTQSLSIQPIVELNSIPACDIILIAVSDHAIALVSNELPQTDALVVHTSGITHLDTLSSHSRRGVFYPLQTISKYAATDFSQVPFLVESNSTDDTELLKHFAGQFSSHVVEINSEQRQHLHVAAVFANNFSNHMFVIASHILEQHGMDLELLKPLILETATKIQTQHPKMVQTGPAKRDDTEAMEKHMSLLNNFPEFQQLYKEISDSIRLHSNFKKG